MNNVYLKAAEMIAEGKEFYSCHAIKEVLGRSGDWIYDRIEVKKYIAMFSPCAINHSFRNLPNSTHHYDKDQIVLRSADRLLFAITYGAEESKHFRVMLLCMMAQLEAEDMVKV